MAKNKRTKNFDTVIKSKNPKKRKRKGFSFIKSPKYFIAGFVFLLVAGSLVYYFFFSGEFEITSVEIMGVNPELTTEVNAYYEKVAGEGKFVFLSQSNTLLFPENSFEENIIYEVPQIKNVDANVTFPNELTITAQERKQKGIWCNYSANPQAPNCYFYDFSGFIYEDAPGVARGSLIVAIRDTRTLEVILPQQVLDNETVTYLDSLIETLEAGYQRPVYITLGHGSDIRIGFSVSGGQAVWEAYISRSNPTIETVENLALVLDEKIGTRVGELEYIDLRLGNKVFFKYKGLEAEPPATEVEETE